MEKFAIEKLYPFEDVVVISCKNFSDERGHFSEYFNQKDFEKISENKISFVQDNFSFSKKSVLRGMHFQKPPFAQAKLVRVLKGEIFDVVVDLRRNGKTFAKWAGINLRAIDNKMLFVPQGFAHGFLSLSEKTELLYKCSQYYNRKSERTLIWSDESVSVEWPTKILSSEFIISDKDKSGSPLSKLLEERDLF